MEEKKSNMQLLWNDLKDIESPWAITGGANHYIRGMVKDFNDVDIITNQEGGVEISKKLYRYSLKKYSYTKSKKIKSYYATFDCNGLVVEIMGDPINLVNGEWVENNLWKNQVEAFQTEKNTLLLTSLKYELYIYSLLNNHKKSEFLLNY